METRPSAVAIYKNIVSGLRDGGIVCSGPIEYHTKYSVDKDRSRRQLVTERLDGAKALSVHLHWAIRPKHVCPLMSGFYG